MAIKVTQLWQLFPWNFSNSSAYIFQPFNTEYCLEETLNLIKPLHWFLSLHETSTVSCPPIHLLVPTVKKYIAPQQFTLIGEECRTPCMGFASFLYFGLFVLKCFKLLHRRNVWNLIFDLRKFKSTSSNTLPKKKSARPWILELETNIKVTKTIYQLQYRLF